MLLNNIKQGNAKQQNENEDMPHVQMDVEDRKMSVFRNQNH